MSSIAAVAVFATGVARAAEQELGSWVIIQGEPAYATGAECSASKPTAEHDAIADTSFMRCPAAEPGPPGLRFRLDLLPEIHASAAEERRHLEMSEARRRALVARGVRPPILSPNGDIPFTYSFVVEEKGIDNRYTRDTLEARGNVAVAGVKVEASLSESAYASISGASRTSKLRAEAPVAFGPVRLRAGLDTYSIRDTTAGAAATKVGHGMDARMSVALSRGLDGEISGKVQHVRDNGSQTSAIGSGALHYGFVLAGLGLDDWQARLSPGVEVSQAIGDSPASMAVRMGVSIVNGPQKAEFSQRVYRQALNGADTAEDHETVLNYRYSWPRSSISLRGSRVTHGKDADQPENWQLGAVWTLKLEALADYFP